MNAINLEVFHQEIFYSAKVHLSAFEKRRGFERDKIGETHTVAILVEVDHFGCGKNVKCVGAGLALVDELVEGIDLGSVGVVGGGAPLSRLFELAALYLDGNGMMSVAIEHHMAATGCVPQIYKFSLHHQLNNNRIAGC